MTVPPRRLPARHAVYEIAPGLLLVFKPRGHREGAHAHPHRQRLLVRRGSLVVRTTRTRLVLGPLSGGAGAHVHDIGTVNERLKRGVAAGTGGVFERFPDDAQPLC